MQRTITRNVVVRSSSPRLLVFAVSSWISSSGNYSACTSSRFSEFHQFLCLLFFLPSFPLFLFLCARDTWPFVAISDAVLLGIRYCKMMIAFETCDTQTFSSLETQYTYIFIRVQLCASSLRLKEIFKPRPRKDIKR